LAAPSDAGRARPVNGLSALHVRRRRQARAPRAVPHVCRRKTRAALIAAIVEHPLQPVIAAVNDAFAARPQRKKTL
jgi:hypothetical protein